MFLPLHNLHHKLSIYKNDLRTKGLYWSVVHRLYKIPHVKKVIISSVNALKPEFVIVDGLILFIDKHDTVVSTTLVIERKWEETQTRIFKKHIHKGDVVVDAGAHIGYYTLLAARKVGKTGKVYAFEPDPKNFALLKKNVDANGFADRVVLVRKALVEKRRKIKLYTAPHNTGDHRVYNSRDGRKAITIDGVTLDEYVQDSSVDFLKLDVQGSELQALRGGSKLLKKSRSLIIMTEFWPGGIIQSGDNPQEYIDFFRKRNFILFSIDEQKQTVKKILDMKKFLHSFSNDVEKYAYLLCKKM